MLNDVFYGSADGGWVYSRVDASVLWPVTLAVLLATGAAVLLWATRRFVDARPVPVVLAWLVLGTGAQLAARTLVPHPDAEAVGGRFDGYNRTAEAYPLRTFLRDYRALHPRLYFHVRANLAGKVVFYHAIRAVDDTPTGLLLLIVGASNLGGVLAYALARDLFADRRAGLAALALYLVVPAKLFFLPLLNAVTPAFVLLPLWLTVRFLASRNPVWPAGVGGALYALVLFDPLPLVTGLVFLALVGRAWALGAVGRRDVLALAAAVPLGFLAANALVAREFGYEVVSAFEFALVDAQEFNAKEGRPYRVWLVANLVETLGGAGLLVSALVVGGAVDGVWRAARAWRTEGRRAAVAVACEPGVCLALATLATLAAVDLMGVNRGETLRLWLFLGVFLQLPAAGLCARRPTLLAALLAGALVQGCVGLATRGFMVPG